MKLETNQQNVNVHGDFAVSDFNIGDISFIVDMFADKVYSHKERAVIRELACNAHDSHVQAGTTDIPFDVHLPTQLEPYFSIRDYGTGLTDQEVRNIFAGIGISTKRDSNDVIGCFGIGSLSPYSLCDSFTVKSYHNGTLRHYTCYRDENRKPVVALLVESATDEHNGLEVNVCVEDRVFDFEQEALYVFRFWDGTLPNINNKKVSTNCQNQRDEYVFKGDDFGLSSSWGTMFAVMGNIAYKIPDEIEDIFDCSGYLKFDLGELNFDTARENLSMDDKTISAIQNKVKKIKSKLSERAIQQIDEQPTDFQKAKLAEQLSCGRLGEYVTASLDEYRLPRPNESVTFWQKKYSYSSEKYSTKHVPIGKDVEYYIHKERMQSRIKSYLKDFASGHTMVIFKDIKQANECKIDPELILDLDDLPKVVRHSYSTGGVGSKVKTFAYNETSSWSPAREFWKETELDINAGEIIYVEIKRWRPENGNRYISSSNNKICSTLETLRDCGINTPTVIGLKTAFLKTSLFKSGNFITLDDYVKREFIKIAPDTHSVYDKSNLRTIQTISNCTNSKEAQEILDFSMSLGSNKIGEICERIGIDLPPQKDTSLQDRMDSFFDRFEMFTILSDWEIQTHKGIVERYIEKVGCVTQ